MPTPTKKYKGDPLRTLTPTTGLRFEVDSYGLVTGTANFSIECSDLKFQTGSIQNTLQRFQLKPGSPILGGYFINKVSANRENGEKLAVTVEFMGIDRTIAAEGGNRTNPNVEGNSLTQAAPIETHRNFETVLGGTPTNPKNGAMFDTKTGLFKGFTARTAGTPNDEWIGNFPLAGVRSYLTPGFSIKGSFYTQSTNDLAIAKSVGKWNYEGTFNSVALIPLDIKGAARKANTDYLLTSVSIERFAAGKMFKINFELLRSEDPGWHPKIYDQAT
jgi:hypothetical protein